MGDDLDAVYVVLLDWNETYAKRWRNYLKRTKPASRPALDHVVSFWSLELASVDVPCTRNIRLHLTSANSRKVICDIVRKDILPILKENESLFLEMATEWES